MHKILVQSTHIFALSVNSGNYSCNHILFNGLQDFMKLPIVMGQSLSLSATPPSGPPSLLGVGIGLCDELQGFLPGAYDSFQLGVFEGVKDLAESGPWVVTHIHQIVSS
jgi:hypothetical protein